MPFPLDSIRRETKTVLFIYSLANSNTNAIIICGHRSYIHPVLFLQMKKK